MEERRRYPLEMRLQERLVEQESAINNVSASELLWELCNYIIMYI